MQLPSRRLFSAYGDEMAMNFPVGQTAGARFALRAPPPSSATKSVKYINPPHGHRQFVKGFSGKGLGAPPSPERRANAWLWPESDRAPFQSWSEPPKLRQGLVALTNRLTCELPEPCGKAHRPG